MAIKRDLNEFAPQAFANIVWAYATNDAHHAALFQTVGDGIVAMDDLSSFDPQALGEHCMGICNKQNSACWAISKDW